MRTFLVHDWLYTFGGAERVLEAILECVKVDKIMALVDFLQGEERAFLKGMQVNTSFLQKMPWARSKRRSYLPLMPMAIESLEVYPADLVISSSSLAAKGVLTSPQQLHICYCHQPARYVWDLTYQYLKKSNLEKGIRYFLASFLLHYIRLWDVSTSNRVDHFISNSKYTAGNILRVYRRESTVIYPPVDIQLHEMQDVKEDYYITAARLVSYKNVDMIVKAFNKTRKKLLVAGDGPDMKKIKSKATGNIKLLGYCSKDVLAKLIQRARALIHAADESFGIISVEAQACGTPVIAYGRGGSLETVRGVYPGSRPSEETTGIFFPEQTVASLLEAVDWFEQCAGEINPAACRRNAEQFSRERFLREFSRFVEAKWAAFEAHDPR